MTITAKKANMMWPDVVKPDVKPSRNGPLAVPSSAPGCLPSCSQRTGCWECKRACRCEKVGPPSNERTLCFLIAPMVVCQADLPSPCSSPGDLGTYFLLPHTHTHTVCCCCCCSCYGNGGMHWRVKPAFQRKTLCSPLPPLPGTHLMQIEDSPNT